jgi:exopolysaccharide biosynthesis predicted pyruvyltransferase EpsI
MIRKIQSHFYKKQSFKKVLNAAIKNDGVINIHRYDINNVGDLYCAPHQYFKELKGAYSDIFLYKRIDKESREKHYGDLTKNALIIGGGGLLNRGSFTKQMQAYEQLAAQGKKTVLWGVGHNEKNPSRYGKVFDYNINVNKFGLVGTRDYNAPGEWLPCVSCLHELFDKSFKVEQELGIIFHKNTVKKPQITTQFKEFPTTSNTTNLKELIEFIGRSEHIVTDSYHAMYWSMLLGKKVAVVPNSSKFFDFKYQPVITTFNDALKDVQKARTYPGLIEECRELNRNFAKRAFEYLELA